MPVFETKEVSVWSKMALASDEREAKGAGRHRNVFTVATIHGLIPTVIG